MANAQNKPTTAPAAAASKPASKPAAPAALALPAASVVASPAKGRTSTMAGAVGATYAVACTMPATAGTGAAGQPASTTVLLPYQLPAWAGKPGAPVTVVVASTAPNWLGRNGHPLQCTVYHSPAGCVVVQPHAKGVQVNAYPQMPGNPAPIAVHGMQAATQAQA